MYELLGPAQSSYLSSTIQYNKRNPSPKNLAVATRALGVLHKAAQHHSPPSTPASPCQLGAGSARMAPVGTELVGGASPLLSDYKSVIVI